MNKIDRKGEWGAHQDMLDGVPLKNMEFIIVRWPDGIYEQIQVLVDRTEHRVPDHGHDYIATQFTAYYCASYKGVQIRVPLHGVEAQRVP